MCALKCCVLIAACLIQSSCTGNAPLGNIPSATTFVVHPSYTGSNGAFLSAWQRSSNDRGEMMYGFYLSSFDLTHYQSAEFEGDRNGLMRAPGSSWIFSVALGGRHGLYFKADIVLASLVDHELLEIDSGCIAVSRDGRTLDVLLYINRSGELQAFEGNGTYRLPRNAWSPDQEGTELGVVKNGRGLALPPNPIFPSGSHDARKPLIYR